VTAGGAENSHDAAASAQPTTGGAGSAPTSTSVVAVADKAPTTAAPSSPVHQLVEVVTTSARGPGRTHRAVVELTPPELGTVRLEIRLRDGSIDLHVRADNEKTATLLRSHLEQLREELEAAGLTTGRLEVGIGASGGEHVGSFSEQPDRPPRQSRRPVANASTPVVPLRSRVPRPDAIVDVLA